MKAVSGKWSDSIHLISSSRKFKKLSRAAVSFSGRLGRGRAPWRWSSSPAWHNHEPNSENSLFNASSLCSNSSWLGFILFPEQELRDDTVSGRNILIKKFAGSPCFPYP